MKHFRCVLFCLLGLCAFSLGGCRRAPVPPPFDVPALIGLPIDALTQRLGAPTSAPNSANPNQRVWTKNDATLSATFKPTSGRVTELTLVSRAAEDAVRDGEQSELLAPGRLKSGDARYSVDWIEASERPLFYVGARIVPAPRTYNVQVRVSGPPDLLQVSYAMSGSQTPNSTFLTIAPWDATATLADDAQIQLSARLAQSGMLAGTPIITEILVDGKVVAIKKASVVADCSWEL